MLELPHDSGRALAMKRFHPAFHLEMEAIFFHVLSRALACHIRSRLQLITEFALFLLKHFGVGERTYICVSLRSFYHGQT